MLVELAYGIEEELSKISTFCTRYGEIKENGASWYFELEHPNISGFLWCEDNAGNMNIPVVSIELILDDISYYTREELINVFEMNKTLMGCSLGIYCPDETEMLTIIYRTDARDFKSVAIKDCIDFTLVQVAGLVGSSGFLDIDSARNN